MSLYSELPENLNQILDRANAYAAYLGLLTKSSLSDDVTQLQLASFTLTPSIYPKSEFQKAEKIQLLYHDIFIEIIKNHMNFVEDILNPVQDDLLQKLLEIYRNIKNNQHPQTGTLQIFRNDYMTDESKGLKQIEFNNIAVSISPHAEAVGKLHNYLQEFCLSNKNFKDIDRQENRPASGIVDAFKCAFDLYGIPDAYVLFVALPNEWNFMDQSKTMFELNKLGIKTMTKSLEDLSKCKLGLGEDGKLFIEGDEIAIVYYRSGYDLAHYPSEACFTVRELIERSKAIKCKFF